MNCILTGSVLFQNGTFLFILFALPFRLPFFVLCVSVCVCESPFTIQFKPSLSPKVLNIDCCELLLCEPCQNESVPPWETRSGGLCTWRTFSVCWCPFVCFVCLIVMDAYGSEVTDCWNHFHEHSYSIKPINFHKNILTGVIFGWMFLSEFHCIGY